MNSIIDAMKPEDWEHVRAIHIDGIETGFWRQYCIANLPCTELFKMAEIRGSLLMLFFFAIWFSVLNWVHDGAHMS
jgi:hypothetical protein